MHTCTDEDIELYFPKAELVQVSYLKEAACFDDLSEIYFYGSSVASNQARNLIIEIAKCSFECKTDEEIDNFFSSKGASLMYT